MTYGSDCAALHQTLTQSHELSGDDTHLGTANTNTKQFREKLLIRLLQHGTLHYKPVMERNGVGPIPGLLHCP